VSLTARERNSRRPLARSGPLARTMAEGACACGRVTVQASSPERGLAAINHGAALRRWTGAAFWVGLLMPAAVVEIRDSRGALREWRDDGASAFRLSCGECGTPLGSRIKGGASLELNLGILRGNSLPKPKCHIFCAEGLSWVLDGFKDGLERFDQAPTKPAGGAASAPAASASPARQAPPPPPTKAASPAPQRPPSQQQQYDAPGGRSGAAHAGHPPSPVPPPSGELVRVQYPHMVDESNAQIREHGIIAIPADVVVELVRGTLESGLGGPYKDYVEVRYNGRVGKVSKAVLVKASQSPAAPAYGVGSSSFAPPPAMDPSRPGFFQSPGFQGERPGYVFQNGTQGVGYYSDTGAASHMPPQEQQRQMPYGANPSYGVGPPGVARRF